MKHVLAINYTQSGQLNDIINRFIEPFKVSGEVEVEHVNLFPENPFPFPWTGDAFWGAMPGCVLEEGMPMKDFDLKRTDYDLIIFGYQPWFLSVSLPSMGILKHPKFKQVVKDIPVVTIIGARNMWLNAQETVKKSLSDAGAHLVANIPLIDRHNNLVSVVTILYWMLTTKKDRMWGIFPKPGVKEEDVAMVNKPGKLVLDALLVNEFSGLQEKIHKLGQINIATSILFIELRAKKLFRIWANLIRNKGTTEKKRKFWTGLFKYYLLIALFLVSPIVLLIYKILILPFTTASVKRKKMYFYGLN